MDKRIEVMATKLENTNPEPSPIDIGMYFMDQYAATQKRRDIFEIKHDLLEYYFLLGLASQGRTSEITETYIRAEKDFNKAFVDFLNEIKPRLLKMNKVSEKVAQMRITDIKSGESVGEWQNRKVKPHKTFMDEFEYFKNFDIETKLKSIL